MNLYSLNKNERKNLALNKEVLSKDRFSLVESIQIDVEVEEEEKEEKML